MSTYKQNSSLNRRTCCRRGLKELNSGRRMTSGHTAGVGVPQIRLISSNWTSSWLDWNSGFLVNSSPRMHLKTQKWTMHIYTVHRRHHATSTWLGGDIVVRSWTSDLEVVGSFDSHLDHFQLITLNKDAPDVRRARLQCSCSKGMEQRTSAYLYCRQHWHF